jgi:type VI secretion system VasD/TssJ family lipoprotein
MKKIYSQVVLMTMCLSFAACTATIKQPEWKFEKEAVRVHIKADYRLNLYNGKPHTLYVCFYQLSELNAFDQLTQDEDGIRKLLESRLFDPNVAAVSNKTILPGENITLTLDRAERAQYLAVVSGYYARLSDIRMVRRYRLQVFKKRDGFFKRTYQCIPCGLDVELILGPNQIESSKLIVNNEKCRNECK